MEHSLVSPLNSFRHVVRDVLSRIDRAGDTFGNSIAVKMIPTFSKAVSALKLAKTLLLFDEVIACVRHLLYIPDLQHLVIKQQRFPGDGSVLPLFTYVIRA